jgi:GNAT superfamily N-acetyltransferase
MLALTLASLVVVAAILWWIFNKRSDHLAQPTVRIPLGDGRDLVTLHSDSDLANAASTMAHAFVESPWYVYLFPGDQATRVTALTWLFHRNMQATVRLEPQSVLALKGDGRILCCFIISTSKGRALSFIDMMRVGLLQMPFKFGLAMVSRMETVIKVNETEERKIDSNCGQYAKVQRMVVVPSEQGKGIGSLCLKAALKHCVPRGTTIDLTTNEARNVPFYERVGFKLKGEYSFKDTEGAPPVHSWYMQM